VAVGRSVDRRNHHSTFKPITLGKASRKNNYYTKLHFGDRSGGANFRHHDHGIARNQWWQRNGL